MRKLINIAVLTLVTGCTTQSAYVIFKPGVSLSETVAATDQCKIASFREIPQSIATDVSGGYYNPGTVQCNTYGNTTSCNRVGAVNIAPTATTYDVNQELRDRYIARCLEAKGFSITESRPCASAAESTKAVNDRANGIRPSCAVETMRRPLLRSQPSPFRRRMSFLWYDVENWKWWPRLIGAALIGVLALAISSAINNPMGKGGTPSEKCWNWGGRSDDTFNC